MRIAITADLHWDHSRRGDEATLLLVDQLRRQPPDVLVLAGDLGTGEHFAECLALFDELACIKALVPGNHDVWVTANDARGDSLDVYQVHLPAVSRAHGFHYLDHAPLVLDAAGLALVGTMNWYDYSWSLQRLQAEVPNWEYHLVNKQFTRGRHNDNKFVRWRYTDVSFTREVVERFAAHLDDALRRAPQAIAVTHHPAFPGISFPGDGRPLEGLDPLLWAALAGNTRIVEVLAAKADRIPLIFSGHTHRANQGRLGAARGYNIGGDYHFKRMLEIAWPEAEVQTHVFGDPSR